MAKSRIQRAAQTPDGAWGCPDCHRPIHPPLIAVACIKDGPPPDYWQVHYECACHTRYAIAVTIDLDHIDAERTATMPIRAGIAPILESPPPAASSDPLADPSDENDESPGA